MTLPTRIPRLKPAIAAAFLLAPALLLLPLVAAAAGRADLSQIQSVYLLPMGYGLDQYLANRLTAEGVFQVVTDPKRADAVLTDQIGAGFERRLDDLIPREEAAAPPPPPPAAGVGTAPTKEESAAADRAKKEFEDEQMVERLKRQSLPPLSSFSRGKGNVFIVDLKTRRVLWALYERPKRVLPDDLNRTSARIVDQLKKDLAGKP